jgi:hypothetical protein
MSSGSGDRKLCKTCNIWISSFPANVARHETSELHKGNIKKLIREADEIRKRSQADESAARKELDRVTIAAKSMIQPRFISHPLESAYDVEIMKQQKEPEWVTCRTETGNIYYANRITGVKQSQKPVELGGARKLDLEEGKNPNAPPKPRTVAKPPPRPRTTVNFPKTTPGIQGDSEILNPLLAAEESPDSSTGFGEWEDVKKPEDQKNDSQTEVRELKRHIDHEGDVNVSFNRTVTRKKNRITREED